MNFVADALKWHAEQLDTHASVPITYRRGGVPIDIVATLLDFDRGLITTTEGVAIDQSYQDWRITSSLLVFGGSQVEPMQGDIITLRDDGEGSLQDYPQLAGVTYRVNNPPGFAVFEYMDGHRTEMRVHTLARR